MTTEEAINKWLTQRRPTYKGFKLQGVKEETIRAFLTESLKHTAKPNEFIFSDEVNQNIEVVMDWLTNPNNNRWGLMLYGGMGNGKTTFQDAIFCVFNACREFKVAKELQSCKRITSSKLLQKTVEELKPFAECDLLVIDDLGLEPNEVVSFGNVTTPIVDILLSRYEYRRTTIVSTNLPLVEFRTKYGDRIADRFREMMQTIYFKDKSYRK